MNRELAKYMLSLDNETSIRIWLDSISKSARNGTVNLMYKELLIDNRFSKKSELLKYFNPKEAEKHGVIKVLVDTDSFVSINFRLKTKQEAGPAQLKLIEKEKKNDVPEVINKSENKVVKSDFNNSDNKYQPTQKIIKTAISDYIIFFKQLQIDKAAMIGRDIEAVPPNINGEDIKHIKELCMHFSKLPSVNNEESIIKCFHRVYMNWFHLSDFVQKGFELRHISRNINQIIIQIQNLNNGSSQDKRETEINQKINRAGQKDYSRLARTRETDNK
jgi:hypothetical protein